MKTQPDKTPTETMPASEKPAKESKGSRSKSKKPDPKQEGDKPRRRLLRVMLLALGIAAIATVVAVTNRDKQIQADREKQAQADGSDKGDKTEEADKPIPEGEKVRRGNFEAELLGTKKDFKPANPLEAPEEGKKIVAVEFKLTNLDSDPVLVSANRQFVLKDPKTGTRYKASPTGVPDPRFPEGRLAPGQTVQGWLAFKVPSEAGKMALKFDARVVALPS